MERNTIAIILTDNMHSGLVHDFFSRVLDAFKVKLEEHNYYIQFLNNQTEFLKTHSYKEQLLQGNYSGVFIVNTVFSLPTVQEILDMELPSVCLDYTREGTIGVFSDNVNGVRNLVKYVALERGHKRIAYIKGDEVSEVTDVRFKAFQEMTAECECTILPEYIVQSKYRDMRMAGRFTEELLALPVPPTCILYPDDFAAIGGINIIHNRGLEVPKDISYCGYDGVNMVSLFDPQITTVVQDTTKIGETAADLIVDQIRGNIKADGSSVIIPTTIQTGHTVRKLFI